jgi:hypothetical protein
MGPSAPTTDESAEARKQHYAETDQESDAQPEPSEPAKKPEDLQFEIKPLKRKELLKEWGDALEQVGRLQARNDKLAAALNAKEAEASRNWPPDMTAKQVKRRDKCLENIAGWQRELEQLYGEVTGRPSWRVEVVSKDGKRLGTGARFGTRGEAEFYDANFARQQVGDEYATGEVIPCETDKPNVWILGDAIGFKHGDCVLLNWHPVGGAQ